MIHVKQIITSLFKYLLCTAITLCSQLVEANVSLPSVFGNNMVLQRNAQVAIYGSANIGENVTVTFANQTKSTVSDGKWKVLLDPLVAGGPYTLTVKGANTVTYVGVLVGDVWFGSGQSNMANRISDEGYSGEVGGDNYPNVRINHNGQGWLSMQGGNISNVSACAYFFARASHLASNVPIGIIVGAYPASEISTFMEGGNNYNNLVVPAIGYTISGCIWNQGEQDASKGPGNEANYSNQLRSLITDWRSKWGINFPFVIYQLPRLANEYRPAQTEVVQPFANEAAVRQGQFDALSLTKTALVTTWDISDGNIHPHNKIEVNNRAVLAYRRFCLGEAVEYMGPICQNTVINGGQLELSFIHVGKGLSITNGTGFGIAGSNNVWYTANASLSGNKLILSHPSVSSPTQARYMWADNIQPAFEGNFKNSAGLACPTFRTNGNYRPLDEGLSLNDTNNIVRVTNISITPVSSLLVGASTNLVATIQPANATNTGITWSSSDPNVATVGSTGILKAVKAGTTLITATLDGKSATTTVTVVNPESIPVKRTLSSVTIDGDISESVWELDKTVLKNESGTNDNKVTFGLVWDDSYLYVAASVQDANLYANGANPWDNDAIEIFLDGNNSKGVTYDANDIQIIKQYNSPSIWTSRDVSISPIVNAVKSNSGGYSIEMAIPWAVLGGQKSSGSVFGFDIANDDNDAGTGRTGLKIWTGNGDNWSNTSLFASLVLSDITIGTNVPLQSISLVPSSVTINKGASTTITPTILPTNASNKTISWTTSNANVASVTNGVVVGLAAGIAVITATTNDGQKSASATVTVNESGVNVKSTPTGLIGTNFWSAEHDIDANGAVVAGNNGYGFAIWKAGTRFANNPANPWNEQFLSEISIYSTLRFMDWENINWGINRFWNERTQKYHQRQSSDPGIQWAPANKTQQDGKRTYGVAYEWMIDLCNRTNANMWINIPYMAMDVADFPNGNDFNNDYVHKLAILLRHGVDMKTVDLKSLTKGDLSKIQSMTRDQLVAAGGVVTSEGVNSNLKIYVELSNEPWLRENHNYAANQGNKLDPSLTAPGYYAQYEWVAWGLPRMWKAFADVFGANNPQVVRLLCGVFWWDAHVERVMTIMNTKYNPWNFQPSHYSWATYIGGSGTNDQLGQFRSDLAVQSANWKKARDFVKNKWNLRMVSYEGGQHFEMGNGQIAFAKNPDSYTAYTEWLTEVNKYFDLVNHYTHSGSVESWDQSWGALMYQGQPISEAHKYRALVDWVKAHPSGNDVVLNVEDEQIRMPNIFMYPNPLASGSSLTLKLPDEQNGNVEVFDINGKILLKNTISNSNAVLNTNSLQSGIYFLRVNGSFGTYTSKFTIVE